MFRYVGPLCLIALGALLVVLPVATLFRALFFDEITLLRVAFWVFAGVCLVSYGLHKLKGGPHV